MLVIPLRRVRCEFNARWMLPCAPTTVDLPSTAIALTFITRLSPSSLLPSASIHSELGIHRATRCHVSYNDCFELPGCLDMRRKMLTRMNFCVLQMTGTFQKSRKDLLPRGVSFSLASLCNLCFPCLSLICGFVLFGSLLVSNVGGGATAIHSFARFALTPAT